MPVFLAKDVFNIIYIMLSMGERATVSHSFCQHFLGNLNSITFIMIIFIS